MFKIEQIDTAHYRKQTRQATIKIMAMFIVIGFITSSLAVYWFADYSNNKIVLNFIGAFVGLAITAWIVKRFFADKSWMQEALYALRLKRNLMQITNKIRPITEAAQAGDQNAMKILRFYHLGLSQMHKLEDNNSALLEIKAAAADHAKLMTQLGLELDQTSFDSEWIEDYQNQP